jgi:selenocysteine lyase/cysteine desulfurase
MDALADAERAFRAANPGFARTAVLDEMRATEYARLDRTNQIYLDYTGGGLYAESQLAEHMALLRENVFGNPHSHNPTSLAMTERVEHAREYVLHYFNASPDEYVCIFTPNASGALKLVGESYLFDASSRYAITFDNHNSVNGIREFARAKGARVTYVPVVAPELRLNDDAMREALAQPGQGCNLLAFTAQSNYSGVQHSLEWIDYAHERGWDVLADCAAFVPSNRLDLSRVRPDFVSLSFYKMFGYPTGAGALIARKSALRKLHRPWFGGGTITIASVQGAGHFLAEGSAGFEDGTVNYLMLPAVEIGLRHMERIGIDVIHERVACLTGWLLEHLTALRHRNGQPMARVLGPTDMRARGGTIAFNLFDPKGEMLHDARIEELANHAGISLRTGCFCNPGAGEMAHHFTPEYMRPLFQSGVPISFAEFDDLTWQQKEHGASALRVSVGLASNFADAYRFMAFAESFRDRASEVIGKSASPRAHARPDTP